MTAFFCGCHHFHVSYYSAIIRWTKSW